MGTTKVCCAVADLESAGIRVLGVGEAVSRGIRKGAVIEIDRAAEAVAEAVDLAEQMAGVAIDSARAVSVPSDRKILHILPQQFTVDGQDGVRDAVGMAGSRLEVDAHIVTGANTAIRNVIKVVHKAGLDVDDLVLQ